jgi:hypothetical protein
MGGGDDSNGLSKEEQKEQERLRWAEGTGKLRGAEGTRQGEQKEQERLSWAEGTGAARVSERNKIAVELKRAKETRASLAKQGT